MKSPSPALRHLHPFLPTRVPPCWSVSNSLERSHSHEFSSFLYFFPSPAPTCCSLCAPSTATATHPPQSAVKKSEKERALLSKGWGKKNQNSTEASLYISFLLRQVQTNQPPFSSFLVGRRNARARSRLQKPPSLSPASASGGE